VRSAELEAATSGELVELTHAALGVLASRSAPECPSACLELAERLGASLDLGEAAMASLVGRVDAAAEPLRHRFAGTRGWLTVAMGMRNGRASERMTVARQLPRLPHTNELLSAEKLPYGYAVTICEAVARLSDDDALAAERILLDAALEGVSATRVAKLGERIAQVIAERDGTDDPGRDARRTARSWLRLSRYLGGRGAVRGDLDPELAALLADRLLPLAKPAGPEDTRDQAERNADALRTLLSGGGTAWNATLVIQLTENTDDADNANWQNTNTDPAETDPANGEAMRWEALRCEPMAATSPSADAVRTGPTTMHPAPTETADTAPTSRDDLPTGSPTGTSEPPEPMADCDNGDNHPNHPDFGTTTGREAVGDLETESQPGTGTADGRARTKTRVPMWPLESLSGRWRIRARLADGTPITPQQARVIALNAGISAMVLGTDGYPLYLGRTARFVTTAQRRALEALYETCAADECDIPARICQLDHVFNWTDNGTTDIDRLAPACSFHNRLKYAHPEWFTIHQDRANRWRYTIRRPRPRWNNQGQAQGP
jgi:hypothetical protein